MTKPWLRLYTEALNDPKVQNLSGNLFKIWINLLIIARINDQNGRLPESKTDISFMLRMPEKKVDEALSELSQLGLIDDGIMHNWGLRQFESDKDPSNRDRQKRYRNAHNDRYVTDDSTVMKHPPEQNRYRTDTEQIQSVVEHTQKKPVTRFQKPTVEEVRNYCLERKNSVSPQKFYDWYESVGWKVGKNPMKDWQAAVRTWEKGDNGQKRKKTWDEIASEVL